MRLCMDGVCFDVLLRFSIKKYKLFGASLRTVSSEPASDWVNVWLCKSFAAFFPHLFCTSSEPNSATRRIRAYNVHKSFDGRSFVRCCSFMWFVVCCVSVVFFFMLLSFGVYSIAYLFAFKIWNACAFSSIILHQCSCCFEYLWARVWQFFFGSFRYRWREKTRPFALRIVFWSLCAARIRMPFLKFACMLLALVLRARWLAFRSEQFNYYQVFGLHLKFKE